MMDFLDRAHERAMIKAENRAGMARFLGACMDGLWVRYWPAGPATRRPGKTILPKPTKWSVVSGCPGRNRGRHYDRKRRSAF
jgi:hypothetical protein